MLTLDQVIKQSGVYVIQNSGIAFGIGDFNLLFVIIHLGIVVLSFWYLYRREVQTLDIIFGGMVVASISNLIDRVLVGGVIDYLQLFNLWFNIADVAVVTGLAFLLTNIIYEQFKGNKQ